MVKWSYFAICMVIQWKRMLLYMDAMILKILEKVKNFPFWSVNYLKGFLLKIVALWRNKKNRVLRGPSLLNN